MNESESWASSPATRASMVSNRGRDTGPELALRRLLHAAGFRYFVNRRPIADVRRTADLVFPGIRLAVFVDGCFWHGCHEHHTVAKTNAQFWSEKVTQNRRRDAETNGTLEDRGWTVVRIWEHVPAEDAAAEVQEVVQRIQHLSKATRGVRHQQ